MASQLAPSTASILDNRYSSSSTLILQKSLFLQNPNLIFTDFSSSRNNPKSLRSRRCYYRAPVSNSLNHIPKQFRQENLKEGLMDNYKNTPQYLYGLSPSQMDMFMTEDNPVRRQADRVTEESIGSACNYVNNGGMYSISGNGRGPSAYSMSVSMYRGGGGGGRDRPPTAPPDLPSLLLDARIVYLGMPIVPAVTELIVAQFMWLDYDSPTKPIYLYINSSGTQNEKMETVGSETEAYAIADTMAYCKSAVYTVNCGMAYGQAAMILSLGAKGHRAVQPNSSTKLYLPKVSRSSGAAIDMWIKAKELDANSDYYIELLVRNLAVLYQKIFKGDAQIPKWLSPVAQNLIRRILDPNPCTRITMEEIKVNEWFKQGYSSASPIEDEEENVYIDDSIIPIHEPSEAEKDPESPTQINAFQLIGMSSCLDLSGFFENEDVSERKIRFTSSFSPKELLERIEHLVMLMGFHVHKKNGKLKVMQDQGDRKSPESLSVTAEVFEISPSLYVVELRKCYGDPTAYRQLCKKLSSELSLDVSSSPHLLANEI